MATLLRSIALVILKPLGPVPKVGGYDGRGMKNSVPEAKRRKNTSTYSTVVNQTTGARAS